MSNFGIVQFNIVSSLIFKDVFSSLIRGGGGCSVFLHFKKEVIEEYFIHNY